MNQIEFGDCRETMRSWAAEGVRVQTCVTSPPYFGLRDYGVSPSSWPEINYRTLGGEVRVPAMECCLGLEETPDAFIGHLIEVLRCVRDVLADDGTLWLNIGDSYANDGKWGGSSGGKHAKALHGNTSIGRTKVSTGLKPKDLIGIPWRLAFALQADGWHLRQDIIWHKPNPMPESVRDRCTKAHEYIFLLSKSERYYFDIEAMREPAVGANLHDVTGRTKQRGMADTFKRSGSKRAQAIPGQSVGTHREDRSESNYDLYTRNRRSVWSVATRPYKGAHFATFPPALIEPCILAGSRPGDIVLDPFMGSGTTAQVAVLTGREYRGCELNREYEPLQLERVAAANDELDAASRQADLFQEAA